MGKFDHFNLNSLSTEDLNELLTEVMAKLRHRDAQQIKEDFMRQAHTTTLPETIAKHLKNQ